MIRLTSIAALLTAAVCLFLNVAIPVMFGEAGETQLRFVADCTLGFMGVLAVIAALAAFMSRPWAYRLSAMAYGPFVVLFAFSFARDEVPQVVQSFRDFMLTTVVCGACAISGFCIASDSPETRRRAMPRFLATLIRLAVCLFLTSSVTFLILIRGDAHLQVAGAFFSALVILMIASQPTILVDPV